MANYTEKQKKMIANQEYTNYKLGEPVKIGNKRKIIGYVSDVVNDGTGQNAYVITDKPTSSSASSVKHVTILYQGSSGTLDTFDDAANTFEDWLSNDIPAGVRTITPIQSAPTGQLEASSKTLQNMYAKYPQATFDVYGHSLGSMDAQYAVAKGG